MSPVRTRRLRPRTSQPAVAVHVFPAFRVGISVRSVREAARAALASGGARHGARVSVVVADDATVRALNAQYRGLDEVTDVLAFAWDHEGQWEGPDAPAPRPAPGPFGVFPAVTVRSKGLGEVVVSCPQAMRQAAEKGHPLKEEIALLVVHGVLHLQGYDHDEPDEEARMRLRETSALDEMAHGEALRTLHEGGGHGG